MLFVFVCGLWLFGGRCLLFGVRCVLLIDDCCSLLCVVVRCVVCCTLLAVRWLVVDVARRVLFVVCRWLLVGVGC